jgi:hypothetical protein
MKASFWTLCKHPPCSHILHTCQPGYSRKTSDSQPLWIICSWVSLPSFRATTPAHAFSTPPKVTRSGCKPSSCIHWNNSSALCPRPQFTCPNNMGFQQTTFREDILLNTLQETSILPHLAYMSTKLLPTKVTNLQPRQSAHEQACPLPVHLGWHTHSALPWKWKSRVIQQASHSASFSPTIKGFVGPQNRVRHASSYAWNPDILHSPSPAYNTTTARDRKRILAKASLDSLACCYCCCRSTNLSTPRGSCHRSAVTTRSHY